MGIPTSSNLTGSGDSAVNPDGADSAASQDDTLLTGQIRVLEMVATGAALADILDAVLRLCESQSPEMLCSILLLDPDGLRLRHGAAPSLPAEYMRAIDGASIGPRAGSCGTAAFRAEWVIVEDIGSDPLWSDYKDLALPHGLRACWSTPILDERQKVLGTFAIYFRKPSLPTDLHRRLIGIFTHLAAIAISRRRIEEALSTSETRQRRLVESNVIGVIIIDAHGLIKEANDYFLQVVGYDREDIEAGRLNWIGMTPGGWEAVDRVAFLEIVSAGACVPFEKEFLHKEGRRVPIRASVTRLGGSNSDCICLIEDLTGRKRVEQALKDSHADLERRIEERTAELAAKNRELETFSYSVSHDLKAPLRGIDGYSKLLSEEYGDRLDEEGRRFLANIRLGTVQMHQLIEDMLAYSRLERRTLAIGSVDLRAAVEKLVKERQFDLSQVELSVDIAPGTVSADREGLMIAVRNVLDNAFKFSRNRQPASIAIRSHVDGDRHILSIRDNGTGFAMRHHATIFQIFQRLHRSEEYGGTGVGLAIVQKAMDRMGGKVWAESEPDKGAVFHLQLPCAQAAEITGAPGFVGGSA